jgi:hypothetical protein
VQDRERHVSLPSRLRREPLEDDAFGASTGERGDEHPKGRAPILDGKERGERSRDEELRRGEHQ